MLKTANGRECPDIDLKLERDLHPQTGEKEIIFVYAVDSCS